MDRVYFILSLQALICIQDITAHAESCLFNFTDTMGRLAVPEPDDLANDVRLNYSVCTWIITGPLDSVIQFDIESLDLGYDNATRLVFGMGEQPSNISTIYEEVLQGETPTVVVPHSTAWINVYNPEQLEGQDVTFIMDYKVIPRVICDSPVQQYGLYGMMTSLDYPRQYPINGECTWKINIPENHVIQLTFHEFDLQDDSDFLLIGDGTHVLHGMFTPYTGRLKTSPYVVTFNYRSIWLLFISNHLRDDKGHKGFNVTYVIKPNDSGNEIPPIQTIAIPKPAGDPWVEKITMTISGQSKEQMAGDIELFKATIAGFVRAYCKHARTVCGTQAKHIRAEDVTISNVRQGDNSVDVELSLGPGFPANMAAMSSLHLDKLFDTKTMSHETEQLHSTSDDNSDTGIPLPKWLIGVIAVVAFLVVVFFVLIVYSLLKDRKKPDKTTEDGRSETPSDDTEAAKDSQTGQNDVNTDKTESPAKVETVSETTTVESTAIPNGTTPGKLEVAKASEITDKQTEVCQQRADPEGKSDVNVVEPLQSSPPTQEPEVALEPSSSTSVCVNPPASCSEGEAAETNSSPATNVERSGTSTDSTEDLSTLEHDLSTDL